jgi:prefoldin subunit 5
MLAIIKTKPMKIKRLIFTTLLIFLVTITNGQSKKVLRETIAKLEEENTELTSNLENVGKEKESLSAKLNRIAPIEIDGVITEDEQGQSFKIGDGGWRIELNSLKYKSDLIGQLGTIWVQDSIGKLSPQGGFLLSEFRIEPRLINPDKEVIYKKFISKSTNLKGDGGAPFLKITSKMSLNEYSQFIINIEGTSEIVPSYKNIEDMASKIDGLFDIKKYKGVFICTGMHVVKYNAVSYQKSDGNSTISSPIVNIGGDFYAESSDEYSDYLVVRQLTELHRQSKKSEELIAKKLDKAIENQKKVTAKSEKISPQQILRYILKRNPTLVELNSFESNPLSFAKKIGFDIDNNKGKKELIEEAKSKINNLPKQIISEEK